MAALTGSRNLPTLGDEIVPVDLKTKCGSSDIKAQVQNEVQQRLVPLRQPWRVAIRIFNSLLVMFPSLPGELWYVSVCCPRIIAEAL
jgi:hypothetical protein